MIRKTPLLLSGFFIFVTLNRVASFSATMGDTSLNLAFSIGLGLTVFVSSYWTQYKGNTNAKETEQNKIESVIVFSWFVLVVSVFIDGAFNLADVLRNNETEFFVVVYGITPTLISLLLGILQAKIDTLPIIRAGWSYQIGSSAKKYILSFFDNRNQPEPTGTNRNTKQNEPEQTEPEPEVFPVGFPDNGTTKEQAKFLYTHNPQITGSEIGKLIGVSGSRGRALLRGIKSNGNGNGKIKEVA